MTLCAAAYRTAFEARIAHLGVTVATEGMKIMLNRARQFGPDLVAEIAGIATGLVKEIVMTSRAFHRAVIMMVEINREQRPRQH